MSEKWTIRKLTPDEYPDTQLRYEVRDETDVVSLHFWEEDAEQMAAFPLMLEALEAAFTYVLNYALYDDDYRANIDLQCPEHEEKLAKQLKAALEAAKGE
jgi:hypothetical protein